MSIHWSPEQQPRLPLAGSEVMYSGGNLNRSSRVQLSIFDGGGIMTWIMTWIMVRHAYRDNLRYVGYLIAKF